MWRFLGLEGASQDGTGRMVSLGGRQLRLQRVMAEGGHATIYEARDTGSGARLAVKRVLVPEERAAAAARELEIHRSLRHDNLLALLGDSHERRKDGTEEFLALLPYAGGGHLWEYATSAPMKPLAKLRALEHVAAALAHMHSKALTHFDVKIENVLVSSPVAGGPGPGPKFALCDFGSARESPEGQPGGVLPSDLDRRGRMELEEWVGAHTTPMYRAPELCDLHNGLRLGPPADVWALGCLLFTLCFGVHPFADASPVQILSGKWGAPPGAVIDDAFLALIRAMLRLDPASRPRSSSLAEAAAMMQRGAAAHAGGRRAL